MSLVAVTSGSYIIYSTKWSCKVLGIKYRGKYYKLLSVGRIRHKRQKFIPLAWIRNNNLNIHEQTQNNIKNIGPVIKVKIEDLKEIFTFYQRFDIYLDYIEDVIPD